MGLRGTVNFLLCRLHDGWYCCFFVAPLFLPLPLVTLHAEVTIDKFAEIVGYEYVHFLYLGIDGFNSPEGFFLILAVLLLQCSREVTANGRESLLGLYEFQNRLIAYEGEYALQCLLACHTLKMSMGSLLTLLKWLNRNILPFCVTTVITDVSGLPSVW